MLTFSALNQIQNTFKVTGNLCEVGVFDGKSLVLMSHLLSEREYLYGFDIFPEDTYNKTVENLNSYGKPNSVKLIKSGTATLQTDALIEHFGNKEKAIRLLHIDAGHEYHEVFHKLLLFAPFVRLEGIIIFIDFSI